MKEKYMKEALKEAIKAKNKGEVPVGAIIVKDGKIIARAHNVRESKNEFHMHAEFIAMIKACKKINSWRLDDCELYTTLEPCSMCAGALIQARIKKVYYAAKDLKGGAINSIINLLDGNFNHKVEVESGILESDASKLLKDFFITLRKKD